LSSDRPLTSAPQYAPGAADVKHKMAAPPGAGGLSPAIARPIHY